MYTYIVYYIILFLNLFDLNAHNLNLFFLFNIF